MSLLSHPELFIPITYGVIFGIIGGTFVSELFDYQKRGRENTTFDKVILILVGLPAVVPILLAVVYTDIDTLSLFIGVLLGYVGNFFSISFMKCMRYSILESEESNRMTKICLVSFIGTIILLIVVSQL